VAILLDTKSIKQTFYSFGEYSYEFIHLTEISIDTKLEEREVISTFINQVEFATWTNELRVGKEQAREMLGIPFDNSHFDFSDLHKISSLELIELTTSFTNQYQDNYIKGESYSELQKALQTHLKNIDSVYFANLDHFKDNDSLKLRNPQASVYSYYFLIFWFNHTEDTFTVCEWGED
jgi:hypothetical protein